MKVQLSMIDLLSKKLDYGTEARGSIIRNIYVTTPSPVFECYFENSKQIEFTESGKTIILITANYDNYC